MSELLDRVKEMGNKASRIENTALKAAAEPVAKAMSENVALSSRNEVHIRNDIQISNIKSKDGVKYVDVGPGKDTNWRAKFLEFGTSKMSARPFMGPAFENNKDKIKEIIKNELRNALGL
jgi:HK97 gp10 family phage protein